MMSYGRLVFLSALVVLLSVNYAHSDLAAAERTNPYSKEIATVLRMYQGYKKDFPAVADISATEARVLLELGKVVFIDVRKPEEKFVSMIPGAVSQEVFLNDPGSYRGKTAVAYCTIGYRSGVFAQKMGKKGIRVLNLPGGILAWVLDSGKVERDGEETKRVHVYGKKWNYLPRDYEAVMFGFFDKFF